MLALGTGGVPVFALQIAKMARACALITASSDDKLQKARARRRRGDQLQEYSEMGEHPS